MSKSPVQKHVEAQKHFFAAKQIIGLQNKSIIILGRHLLYLKKDGRWRYVYGDSDFNQRWEYFCEHELKISPSRASRAIDAYAILHKQLQIPEAEIIEADQNTVFQLIPAFKRGDITEEQVRELLPLKRKDVKEELDPHEHAFGEAEYAKCAHEGCPAMRNVTRY